MPTTKKRKPKPKSGGMPPWKVLLLNDPAIDFSSVVTAVENLTKLNHADAISKVTEAHKTGVSLLLVTHKERAELFKEQFSSFVPSIPTSIEADG